MAAVFFGQKMIHFNIFHKTSAKGLIKMGTEKELRYKKALESIINYKEHMKKEFIMHYEFKKFAIETASEAIKER